MDSIELAVFLGDEVARHRLPSSGILTIGRSPECDISIDDGSVSRRHALLHLGPPLRIEDLGSANGTSVRRPGSGREEEVDTYELRRRPGLTFEVALGDRIALGAATAVLRRAPPALDGATPVRDPVMRQLHEQMRRAAQGNISVLLLGETGVGKEVLAREIHRLSPRAAGPFVALHCAALAESPIEAADGGTLLLDEIGELAPAAQVKLLRVLEERAVLRPGARTPKSIDVRIVAATNRDLDADVARGAFRRDLLYRLNGITLTIPPLRRRVADIEPLSRLFLEEACRKMDQARAPSLSGSALEALTRYPWPGNVRELRNTMERAAVLCDGEAVLLSHLPARIAGEEEGDAPESDPGEVALKVGSIEAFDAEREAFLKKRIIEALEQCGGNQTRAADVVGISRRTLVSRLKEYGLPRPRKKR